MKKNLLNFRQMFLNGKYFLKKINVFYTKKILLLTIVSFLVSGFLKSSAQIIDDGNEHFVPYNGTYQDFVIPNNPLIVKITFRLTGGDGGKASVTVGQTVPFIGFEPIKTCTSNGGTGAIFEADFLVGTGPGKIAHGSTVRFIVGDRGESGHTNKNIIPDGGTGFDYGGGGGGTAVLYSAPGSGSWILLGVAGGGGGAYQSMLSGLCLIGHDGQGGRSGENGGDYTGYILGAGQGGSGGGGGEASPSYNGGGGGGSTVRGGSVPCIDEDLNSFDVGEGGPGRDPSFGEVGGYGGSSESCTSIIFDWRNGGFGFGGGGAGVGVGGGGGGYSGGGAGPLAASGGGGGSFVHFSNVYNAIIATGSTSSSSSGSARYEVTLNQAPVAFCKDATIYLNANGQASIVPATINNGSNDPDGTFLNYGLSKSSFTCANIGANNVALTVTDNHGATSTCIAVVTVIDNTIAVITCPANIIVSCAANVPSVNTASVTATDNCPVTVTHVSDVITNQTCASRFTLTRTYKATDASGNNVSCQQVINVLDDQPPVITNASTNIFSLWPANHKMKDVVVNYNTFDNCSAVTTTLSVSSNEPVNGTGDGDTAPDWEIVNNRLVKLRAERAGNGKGRIYTITIKATDGCNNSSTKVVLVYVNHNNDVTATRTPNTQEASKTKLKEVNIVEGLQFVATPNPTNNQFSIYIKSSNNKDKISMQVFDILGRRIELRNHLQTGTSIMVGDKYKEGAYFIRIMQGNEYKVIKVIKLPD
jgi:Secretion system C-terminal sorting domain